MEPVGGYEFENVVFQVQSSVGLLTVNRPRQMNALNKQVLEEILAVFTLAEQDPAVRVIVVTGQGPKAFVAGADISEMEALDPDGALEFSRFGQSVFNAIERCSKPVLAAVNGYALGGGCELALSCDIRIAAMNARLGQPEVGLGIIPGFGGTQRLAKLVGKAVAMELILSGRVIDAGEAFRIGLVNRVVSEGEAVKEAIALAEEISSKSPYALSQAKKAVIGGLAPDMSDCFLFEQKLFAECFAHHDHKEGLRAFLDKRKAEF